MAKVKFNNPCTMKCKKCKEGEFLAPDLKKWEETAARVNTSFGVYLIAPEDIQRPDDGGSFWSFGAALEISKILEDEGWYLPSPAEVSLIMATNALEHQKAIVDAEDLMQDFGLELGGYGLYVTAQCQHSGFFQHEAGEVGAYWTNTPKTHDIVGESGYSLRLRYGTADIYPLLAMETAAKIRLIKRV